MSIHGIYFVLYTYLSVIYRLALFNISLDGKLHRSGRSLFHLTAARVIRAMESFNVLIPILTQRNHSEEKIHQLL